MQMTRICLILLAAAATTASAQDDSYARTEGGKLDIYELLVGNFEIGQPESPKISLRFENPFRATVLASSPMSFKVEWTANGVLQSPDLKSQTTRCISRSSEIWCTARTNWFPPPPGGGAWVNPHEFPQGFYFFNLEYDTRYCIRFQATAFAPQVLEVSNPAPWSRWTCVRTPPAPPPIPLPPAPLQPNVTILPATDGIGVPGGPLPVRALVEWQVPPDDPASASIRLYRIERASLTNYAPNWEAIEGIQSSRNEGETTVAFDAGREPTDERRFLFRVCSENATGRRCSPSRATSPFTPGPLAPKSSRTSPISSNRPADVVSSVTDDAATARATNPRICDLARQARARNSPAAPGLEAKCRAAGGSVPKVALQPQPSTPSPVKAQGRVKLDGSPSQTGATSGTTDGPAVAAQAENTINVRVMYPRAYGYKGNSNAFGSLGPTSCSAFSVSAVVADAGARPRSPIPVSSDARMTQSGASYVCNYLISQVPLDEATTVSVAVLDADLFLPWEGGSATRPPAGEVRTIVDSTRTAMLSSSQPRSRLVYEMIYAPAVRR